MLSDAEMLDALEMLEGGWTASGAAERLGLSSGQVVNAAVRRVRLEDAAAHGEPSPRGVRPGTGARHA